MQLSLLRHNFLGNGALAYPGRTGHPTHRLWGDCPQMPARFPWVEPWGPPHLVQRTTVLLPNATVDQELPGPLLAVTRQLDAFAPTVPKEGQRRKAHQSARRQPCGTGEERLWGFISWSSSILTAGVLALPTSQAAPRMSAMFRIRFSGGFNSSEVTASSKRLKTLFFQRLVRSNRFLVRFLDTKTRLLSIPSFAKSTHSFFPRVRG